MLVEIIHQQHIELSELFARHQEALLQGQFDEASEWLEYYLASLNVHMQIEERYLFPEFANIEHNSKWDVSLYEKEHQKLNQLNQTIKDDLQWLSEQELSPSQQRRNIIALLDKEKTVKGLSEHHEAREEEAMLKELDDAYRDIDSNAELGTAAERARRYKELQMDIKLTWAEVMGAVKEGVNPV